MFSIECFIAQYKTARGANVPYAATVFGSNLKPRTSRRNLVYYCRKNTI